MKNEWWYYYFLLTPHRVLAGKSEANNKQRQYFFFLHATISNPKSNSLWSSPRYCKDGEFLSCFPDSVSFA
jgi:hypothetical protein